MDLLSFDTVQRVAQLQNSALQRRFLVDVARGSGPDGKVWAFACAIDRN